MTGNANSHLQCTAPQQELPTASPDARSTSSDTEVVRHDWYFEKQPRAVMILISTTVPDIKAVCLIPTMP